MGQTQHAAMTLYDLYDLCIHNLNCFRVFSPETGQRIFVLCGAHGGHIRSQRGHSQSAAANVPRGGAGQPRVHHRRKPNHAERVCGAEPRTVASPWSSGSP